MSAPFNNENQKNINNMKKNLSLDFNQVKKNHLSLQGNAVLDSPDINKLNVATPELENMILSSGITVNTPTPSLLYPPRAVTEEQESFATGFVNALNNLHNSNSQASSSSSIYADLDQTTLPMQLYTPAVLKEEPQTVPNSPPLSPVNMQYQEKMKLERKRQRNRLAATKCRTRKLERISRLEDKVKMLRGENAELATMIHQLTAHVSALKVEFMQHASAGCHILQ